jgi:hypothetical protein
MVVKTSQEIIAEVLFCDHGIGEDTKPGEDGNLSDEIAADIVEALKEAGFL